MAVYKVIQDIESEDKLLGPLTLKGFIYAVIAALCAFINFRLVVMTSLGSFRWLLVLVFLFPMLLFALLASPLGRQQPTEVWVLAHLRFLVKPRRRIWDQSGISELVTITVPKKLDAIRTKGLSETEVRSRLQTLANTLDSRGWAIKNLNLQPNLSLNMQAVSDRLVAPTSLSQTTPGVDIEASDDIMDEQNNPTAQYFAGLMQEQDSRRKLNVASVMTTARKEAAMPATPPTQPSTISQPAISSPSADQIQAASTASSSAVTASSRADKLELAQSGSDLSVASIAKLANRKNLIEQIGPNEVVISLH